MSKALDLTGKVFGELTPTKYLGAIGKGRTTFWECLCSCGNTKNIATGHLVRGHTKSCGCKSYISGAEHHQFKHGITASKVHKAWAHIKDRCRNPSCAGYVKYGAKGTSMAPEYLNNFLAFYAEVGEPPDNTYSIDRINHKLGYVKGNMRWATVTQQARNKGKVQHNTSGVTGVRIFHTGLSTHSTYCIAIWCNLEGKARNKSFNCKKMGLLPAFKAAFEYRLKMINEMNAQGAGYASNHGQ